MILSSWLLIGLMLLFKAVNKLGLYFSGVEIKKGLGITG